MLFSSKSIAGYKLNSLDGELGGVKDLLFDDQYWTVRYLVAKTGTWFSGRDVLISPHAQIRLSHEKKRMNVNLTRARIQDSPALSSDQPVSRQFETEFHEFYGWPVYWDGPYMWGAGPMIARGSRNLESPSPPESTSEDPHLRSAETVRGYEIEADDGSIGRVADFIVDDSTWSIRYLVVDTHKWLPGRKVLISPQWIERVSWESATVFVHLTRDAIRNSPEYREEGLLTREYESGLHTHYQRDGYWALEPEGSRERYQEAVDDWDNEGGGVSTVCNDCGFEGETDSSAVEAVAVNRTKS
ncbi:MAG: PRC-barrel domain-containing protein [Verrucomicrobia bacterium]|nr:PRC-barrel domain-containing protein [Verrucomicrobiota bacterium]MCH8528908.1 PRC-barrel domain-containing protein [Kiritimatiellia bacterium]